MINQTQQFEALKINDNEKWEFEFHHKNDMIILCHETFMIKSDKVGSQQYTYAMKEHDAV